MPTGVSRSASGPSVSSVTSSVVSQLQPSIAAAVAEALKASSRPVSRPQASRPQVEEPNYGPAKYNFGYKVADEESQAYINHQESRCLKKAQTLASNSFTVLLQFDDACLLFFTGRAMM